MIKKLKLFYGNGRFTDNGEFIKADNENLIIKIVTEFGSNVNLYASISNGANSTNVKVINNQFEVDGKYLRVGECYITIIAKSGSTEVGRYICTPIVIKELENSKIINDEFVEFRNELNEMKEQLKEVLKTFNEYKSLVRDLLNME